MVLSVVARAFGIGAVSGLRSFTAPAAILATGANPWAGLFTWLAAGECVGDKLPIAPSRLSPPALAWRLISGASCGVVIAERNEMQGRVGFVAGAVGALAAAYAGYALRRYLTKRVGLPDFPVALAEDGIAVASARALTWA